MDETEDQTSLGDVEAEVKELLGLFDAPAFARRGLDLEHAVARLDARCRRERAEMLEMVRLRLKQWTAAASGPETAGEVFARPIDDLWTLADAPPPAWADRPAPARKLRAVARDLVASVERFNRRWDRFLDGLNYEPVNGMIERYNRYYLLEKECTLRSARLAAQHFEPRPSVSSRTMIERHPTLPVPELKA
jgi:hypothetical protein